MKDNSHIWYIVLIGLVVISAVGTLAFLWYTQKSNTAAYQPIETSYTPPPRQSNPPSALPSSSAQAGDAQTSALKQVQTSDEIDQIEKDLINTDLTKLDQEVTKIEESLQ